MDNHPCRPRIDYPCPWVYKVIGRNPERIREAIAEVLAGDAHTVTSSLSSRGRAYHCLNVELTVESEAIRLDLYERLSRHADIVMVL